MSHGAAACASKLTQIGNPLPAVATDSVAARQVARRAVGAREKEGTALGKENTRDGGLFLTLRYPRLSKLRSLRVRSAATLPTRLPDRPTTNPPQRSAPSR